LTGGPGYDAYVAVRKRAGLAAPADGNMTYVDLFNERRVEFALEGLSWLDVKRRYYRNADETLAYLNSQARTVRYFRTLEATTQENDPAGYELVYSSGDPGIPSPLPPGSYVGTGSRTGNANTDPVVSFSASKMRMPVPGNEQVANPKLAPETPAEEFVF
jgi:hypothetical protein